MAGVGNPAEFFQGQISHHDLRKNHLYLTRVHVSPKQMRFAKLAPSLEKDSNRGQVKIRIFSNKTAGYVRSVGRFREAFYYEIYILTFL